MDKLVHPRIRPFSETSEEMGSFLFEHMRFTIGVNDDVITRSIKQLPSMKEKGEDVLFHLKSGNQMHIPVMVVIQTF